MCATLQPEISPPSEEAVRPGDLRRHASLLIVGCAAAWSALVLWHYYASLVHAFAGANPFFDHPVLFDRWLRPFSHVGEALTRSARGIAGAATVIGACVGAGHLVLSKTMRELDAAPERVLFEMGIGFGSVSLLLFGMAAAHAYTPGAVSVVVVALAALAVVAFVRDRIPLTDRRSRHDGGWSYAFAACAILALAVALVGALAPETEYDALWYHLWLPQKWLQAGRPVDIVQEYVSLYPLSWELLYGAAMIIGGAVAAKLLHWFSVLLLAAATASLAKLVFPRTDRALVAALVVTAPTVLWEATTAYADLPPAFFVTLSVIALLRYSHGQRRAWLVLAALTMGCALAIKNLSLVVALIEGAAVLVIEWRRAASVRRAIIAAALFAAIALLPPLPWYARAYAASGNPVFPDMYRVFGAQPTERWDDVNERELARFKAHFGEDGASARSAAARIAALPWDVTVHGSRYAASFGPLFVLLIPFAFLVRRGRGEAVSIACGMVIFGAIWASPVSSLQGRFLIPLVPFAAVLAAQGAAALEQAAGRGRAVITALLVCLLFANLPPFVRWHEGDRRGWDGWLTHVTRALPVAVVTGGESTRDYLERKVPSYAAWEFIDRSVPSDATVLTFSGGDHFYSDRRRIWSDSAVARAVTWGSTAGQEQQAIEAAHALEIDYVIIDKVQAATIGRLAIGSDRMRACCLDRVYEDKRFIVFRIRAR